MRRPLSDAFTALQDIQGSLEDVERELEECRNELSSMEADYSALRREAAGCFSEINHIDLGRNPTDSQLVSALDEITFGYTDARADKTEWKECMACGVSYPYPIDKVETICRYCND